MVEPGDFVARLAIAVAAGALIGLERQWRSREAGLRTNTLVATGAGLFCLVAAMGPRGSNPTQVTAYVVGGVGFLGAGVIISDGVSIRGINTAATLWCAAAAGALAGNGFLWQEGVATAAVLAVNLLLRPLGRRIDRRPLDEDSEVETTYRFTAITTDAGEPHVRALLLQAVAGHGYHLRALRSEDVPDSNRVEVTAELVTTGRDDAQIETAAGRVGLEPTVTAVRWQVDEQRSDRLAGAL